MGDIFFLNKILFIIIVKLYHDKYLKKLNLKKKNWNWKILVERDELLLSDKIIVKSFLLLFALKTIATHLLK